MDTARFAAHVVVTDSDGAFHSFSPGDEVPEWARSRVGDHVIDDGGGSEDTPPSTPTPTPAAPEPEATPPMPPVSGPGSGQPEWVRYARLLGRGDVTGEWSRQDIIDLLIREGLITE